MGKFACPILSTTAFDGFQSEPGFIQDDGSATPQNFANRQARAKSTTLLAEKWRVAHFAQRP